MGFYIFQSIQSFRILAFKLFPMTFPSFSTKVSAT